MEDNNFRYTDDATYNKGTVISVEPIVIEHLRRIGNISSKEFVKGWWEKKPIPTQSGVIIVDVYHEDVREAYCNAIDFLMDLITPKSDSTFKDIIKEHLKENFPDIDSKIKSKRLMFQQVNYMFERTNFFKNNDNENEVVMVE